MAYAAESDLDAKWGAEAVTLAAWNDALVPPGRDETRVAAALTGAGAVIDGYLGRRYTLPISPSPSALALLVALNADLAMGQLCNTPATRTEIVADAEKRALAFMRDVAKGDAAIDVVTPAAFGPPLSPGEAALVRPLDEAAPHFAARDRWRGL